MKTFLYVFYGKHENWNNKSESEWQSLGQKHALWMDKMKYHYKSAGKLASRPSKMLEGRIDAPKVMDGPFSETKEVLTGFYTVQANDMDHAVELAKGNPWFIHDRLEIFEVES